MTMKNAVHPRVVRGDGDPAPSAPPLTASMTADDYSIPTTVLATSVPPPPPFAPHPHLAWTATATATATAADVDVDRRVSRTNEPDGSLSVDVTTTTTSLPDGYREVIVEHFRIPAGQVDAARASMDGGRSPGNANLARVEVRTYPPGTSDDATATATTTTTTTAGHPPPAHHPAHHVQRLGYCARCGICWGVFCLVVILLIVLGVMRTGWSSSSGGKASPGYHYPTNHSSPRPTPTLPPNMHPWPTPVPSMPSSWSETS
jgi:hypothetical protein